MSSPEIFTDLFYILQKITTTINLDQILDLLGEEIEKIDEIDGYYISILDETKENLVIEKIKLPDRFKKMESTYYKTKNNVDHEDSIIKSFYQNRPVFFNLKNLKQFDEAVKGRFKLWEIVSGASLPLCKEEEKLGQIFVFSQKKELNEEKIQLLFSHMRFFFHQIKNAVKYHKIKAKEQEILSIYDKNIKIIEIVTRINTLTSPEAIYSIILEELLKLFSFDIGAFFFQKGNFLVPTAMKVLDSNKWKRIIELTSQFNKEQGGSYDISLASTAMAVSFIRNTHIYINNYQDVKNLPKFPIDQKLVEEVQGGILKSNLIMPVRSHGAPIGEMLLSSYEKPANLSVEDIKIIESICSFISTAIQNAQLYTIVQRQRKEIEAINDITKEINQSLDFNRALNKVISYLKKTYHFEGVALYLVENGRKAYYIELWDMPYSKTAETLKGRSFPLDIENGGRAAEIILHNKHYFLSDINIDSISNPINRFPVELFGIKSILHVPIPAGDEIIGAFTLTTHTKSIYLTETDIESIKRFINQIGTILRNSKIYEELQLKDQIISEDLRLAKNIQVNLISNCQDSIDEIDFYCKYHPHGEVGGDIYDIYRLNDNTVRLFLADATGHGVQAAFSTILIESGYEQIKMFELPPNELLQKLNDAFITRYAKLTVFFSCIIADIDLKSRKLIYSSAGHPEQFMIQKNKIKKLQGGGKLIGLLENMKYPLFESNLEKNDKLLFFTDGLFEEFNSSEEELTEEGLLKITSKHKKKSIKALGDSIYQDVLSYIGNRSLNDDLTLIGFEIKTLLS